MTTLVVTSSWPRTADEMAGTFVRTDAATRDDVLVAAPTGAGTPRGGARMEVVDVPHGGLFGSPGAFHRLRSAPWRAFGLGRYFQAISRLVAERRPATIVAHWLVPGGLVARMAAPSVPVEMVAHGADVRLLEALPRTIAARLIAMLRDGPTAIRAVSTSLAERMEAIRPGSVDWVEPMALGDLSAARRLGAELRAVHGSVSVMATRMIAAKRIERAIDGAAGARLVMLGDGPLRRDLIARASRRFSVIAPGAVPHEQSLAWIAAADLVLAPLAPGEGAPTVIREARALGRPVAVFA